MKTFIMREDGIDIEIPFDMPIYLRGQVLFILITSFLSGCFFGVWIMKL